ncbi:LysR family transcriptional regulator [Phyllobacterium brassicacearum]|uniref:LysR family transcriptional regulator n=1 Tax=Phyllobacterium brassicacearum TaxID=314235 RepID=A0A2P7AXU7_9HYPH|nr:LysR substrate-binding domain-containing protein [Phyllobacterium brassicacearum]PSH59040.1 LysR family transcriptional regulator [Phyllobacterium brassicacearum]TDQ08920.1 LysR family transcriptional regulator [Phyllobacterium brassicacearum]
MDRLTSMAVFVKAAEAGSFAAAAPTLGLSSPMIGKHVRFLEERIGAQLLNRTTRRQSLTEVGRAFYERCKLVLAEAEAAEALAQDLQAIPRGRLRINAPVTFGSYSLVPMLTKYMRRYPEVTVDLTLSDRVVDLIDEGYDAVIRISPLTDSTLITRSLAPYRLIACASPAYLTERGVPATPEDLTDHECLGFAYWARPPLDEWEFTDAKGVYKVKVHSRFLVNNGQALREAALDGFGIILQATDMLTEDLVSGRLMRVLPNYEGPSRPMHILFAPDRRPTPKLRSFVDFVAATFGRTPTPEQERR